MRYLEIDKLKQALRDLKYNEGVDVDDRVFGTIDKVYYDMLDEETKSRLKKEEDNF